MDDGAKSGFELAFFDVDPLWHCCLCWFTQALYVSKACDKKTPDLNRKKRFFKDKKKILLFTHCSNPQVLFKKYVLWLQFTKFLIW